MLLYRCNSQAIGVLLQESCFQGRGGGGLRRGRVGKDREKLFFLSRKKYKPALLFLLPLHEVFIFLENSFEEKESFESKNGKKLDPSLFPNVEQEHSV